MPAIHELDGGRRMLESDPIEMQGSRYLQDGTTGGAGLDLSDIVIRYGAATVLDRVALSIAPGEFLTLLGPSGSGKTTLLMAIAGFVDISRGHILSNGRDLAALPPHKRGLGVVFQSYALFPHMTVGGNVAYPLRVRNVPIAEQRQRVLEALALVKLEGYSDRPVSALSGGQRQRVALARAIVFRPAIMLMDEPLSALDKKLREHMQMEIRRLHEQLGMTTIYVTHDQREALTMSDRVALMRSGRIEQLGTPREIYRAPGSRFVADFIGVSSFLPLEIRSGTPFCLGRRVDLPTGHALPSAKSSLMLRPECLRLTEGVHDHPNSISGRLTSIVYEGDSIAASVASAGLADVKVKLPAVGMDLLQHGASVTLSWSAGDAVIVEDGT